MPEPRPSKPDAAARVVVVTGAAGRLGARLVRRFAADGARVAAVVRTDAQARRVDFGEGRGHAFAADVTDERAVAACFSQVEDRFGRVDALVHTVGAWASQPLLETPLDHWDHVMRVNLTSAFLCFREAARRMAGRGGRLVGIAAAQGVDRGAAEQAAYSAAKGGLVRLVEAAAAELGGDGITAHAIAASFIRYEDDGASGVPADALVDLCAYVCSPAGEALNGATLRAYG